MHHLKRLVLPATESSSSRATGGNRENNETNHRYRTWIHFAWKSQACHHYAAKTRFQLLRLFSRRQFGVRVDVFNRGMGDSGTRPSWRLCRLVDRLRSVGVLEIFGPLLVMQLPEREQSKPVRMQRERN